MVQNGKIFIRENAFENVVSKIAVILSRSHFLLRNLLTKLHVVKHNIMSMSSTIILITWTTALKTGNTIDPFN